MKAIPLGQLFVNLYFFVIYLSLHEDSLHFKAG